MINSAQEFIRLRTSDESSEYSRAAHEEAPMDVWLELVRDYPDMRFWVAHNKKVPIEILQTLARDEDASVREMVAQKRKATTTILELLASDPDDSVRSAVAHNPKTPRYVLESLRDDPWDMLREDVRERLGEHPATP
jgi:hypothetical protein